MGMFQVYALNIIFARWVAQCFQSENSFAGNLIVVSDAQCAHNKPSPETRACQERECELFRGLSDNELPQAPKQPAIISKKEWSVGSWSPVSSLSFPSQPQQFFTSDIYIVLSDMW